MPHVKTRKHKEDFASWVPDDVVAFYLQKREEFELAEKVNKPKKGKKDKEEKQGRAFWWCAYWSDQDFRRFATFVEDLEMESAWNSIARQIALKPDMKMEAFLKAIVDLIEECNIWTDWWNKDRPGDHKKLIQTAASQVKKAHDALLDLTVNRTKVTEDDDIVGPLQGPLLDAFSLQPIHVLGVKEQCGKTFEGFNTLPTAALSYMWLHLRELGENYEPLVTKRGQCHTLRVHIVRTLNGYMVDNFQTPLHDVVVTLLNAILHALEKYDMDVDRDTVRDIVKARNSP